MRLVNAGASVRRSRMRSRLQQSLLVEKGGDETIDCRRTPTLQPNPCRGGIFDRALFRPIPSFFSFLPSIFGSFLFFQVQSVVVVLPGRVPVVFLFHRFSLSLAFSCAFCSTLLHPQSLISGCARTESNQIKIKIKPSPWSW